MTACSGFTPVLAAKYRALCDASGGASSAPVAIVFVSSDRDAASFQAYYAEMPWLALPFSARQEKEDLSDLYGIRGIPSLIILDNEGRLVDSDGRASFEEYFERATHLAHERALLARERAFRGLAVEQQLARAVGLLKMHDEAVLEQRKTLPTLATLLENVIRHVRARARTDALKHARPDATLVSC